MITTRPRVQPTVSVRWAVDSDIYEMAIVLRSAGIKISSVGLAYLFRQRSIVAQVATCHERIVGVAVYAYDPGRLHVLKLGVDPAYQGSGVGCKLLAVLKAKLSVIRPRLTLHCRETNLEAQLFYRANGLRAVSVLRGHYEDTGEDAYVFEYRREGK